MSTFGQYVFRCTLKPLAIALSIALLVLLLERMLRLLDVVLGSRGSLSVLLEMLAFLVPHYMGLGLPAAFFLGIVLAFNRLNRDSELDAFGATGVGLHLLLRPIMGLAILLTLLTALIFGFLQPYARYTYRALIHDVSRGIVNLHLQEGVFRRVEGGVLMADRIARDGRSFSRVFVHREDGDGESLTITASRGAMVAAGGGGPTFLALSDGIRLRVRPADPLAAQDSGHRVDSARFDRVETTLDRNPIEAFRARGEDERELTLTEVWRARASPPEGVTPGEMISEFNDRLVRIFATLFLPFFALPLAIQSRRQQRSYGMVIGLVVLVAYNHLLSVSETLVAGERIQPFFGQWGLFLLFAAGSCAMFYRAAFTVGRGLHPADLLRPRGFLKRLFGVQIASSKGLSG
jgi:lipopolysaccharide export system permease protein